MSTRIHLSLVSAWLFVGCLTIQAGSPSYQEIPGLIQSNLNSGAIKVPYSGINNIGAQPGQVLSATPTGTAWSNATPNVTASAINATQTSPLSLTNGGNNFAGTFNGTVSFATSAGVASSGAWAGNPIYGAWSYTFGQGQNVPDTWLVIRSSNGVAHIDQFSPEGNFIIDGTVFASTGFWDNLNGQGGTNYFQNGTWMANPANNIGGNGSALTALTASQLVGKVPTNNLSVATTLSAGVVVPDGTTITINPSGVITAVGGGGGTGSSNVYFYPSSTITWTTVGGSNQFNVVNGGVNSNNFGGSLNDYQVFGDFKSLTADAPLSVTVSGQGTASLSAEFSLLGGYTGNGSPVFSNAPTIANPTILGYIKGKPPMDGGAVTNLAYIRGITIQNGAATAITFSLNPDGSTNAQIVIGTNTPAPTTATNVANNATLAGAGWKVALDANNTLWLTNTLSGGTPSYGFLTNGAFTVGTPGGATFVAGLLTNNIPSTFGNFANGSWISTTNHYYGVINGQLFQMF